jgi:hypothetical protein
MAANVARAPQHATPSQQQGAALACTTDSTHAQRHMPPHTSSTAHTAGVLCVRHTQVACASCTQLCAAGPAAGSHAPDTRALPGPGPASSVLRAARRARARCVAAQSSWQNAESVPSPVLVQKTELPSSQQGAMFVPLSLQKPSRGTQAACTTAAAAARRACVYWGGWGEGKLWVPGHTAQHARLGTSDCAGRTMRA